MQPWCCDIHLDKLQYVGWLTGDRKSYDTRRLGLERVCVYVITPTLILAFLSDKAFDYGGNTKDVL